MTTESDNLTLEEYLTTLSNVDKELLKGFPLTVDELVDSDDEVLDALMMRQGLSNEEQIKRSEIISKIKHLRIFAVLEREAKQHHWYNDRNDNGNDNGNGRKDNKNNNDISDNKREGQNKPDNNVTKKDQPLKRQFIAYKYSNKGKAPLHESIIFEGRPVFLKYQNGNLEIVEYIEEINRIIKAPSHEEYPYEPYEFTSQEEIQSYLEQAKQASIYSLYLKAKEIVQDYNDQDHNKLVLFATDIIFSYFQDKFATTHYDSVVGDNDSGNSSLGITFEAIGYRPVYMTDPSAANIFRCLGTIEPGQCTIILDEADKIDKSPEMMAILKTGYQLNGKVPKINTNTLRQEFFFTYGFKIIISERSMSLVEAKGVYDRTFSLTAYAGDPKFDIKETLNPQGNIACKSRLEQLRAFRKLMLIYRLVHFNDHVPDIDTGLKRRNRELCKPILQLFHDSRTEILTEIKPMLEHFLAMKKHRKESTIEAALYPIIHNLVSEFGQEIFASQVWGTIVDNKIINGYFDNRKPNEYQTSDYGTIYRNSITNIICDKFGAQKRHKEKGNVLIFDIDKLAKIGRSYDLDTNIQLKLPVKDGTEGSESSEDFRKETDVLEQNTNIGLTSKENKCPQIFEQTLDNKSNILLATNEKLRGNAVKPSESSEPSGANLVSHFPKDIATINTLYRIGHSDNFACKNCKTTGDRFFMETHICGKSKKQNHKYNFNILSLIKCKHVDHTDGNNSKYSIILAGPAKGVLYVTEGSQDYISGQVRMRGKDGGRYPYNYLEMIEHIFGSEEDTIHVCSGSIKGRCTTSSPSSPYTVDTNPALKPDYVADAQRLNEIAKETYSRWMADPPYNARTAKKMYGTELPDPLRLIEEGARVCKVGSLLFLLLGNPYQRCPKGVKRIGCIAITVIPNNEARFLNIYLKYQDV
ncbi:MAG TPA: hypothetical protein VH796_18760 [Nitrososphaeraceae archaeon]